MKKSIILALLFLTYACASVIKSESNVISLPDGGYVYYEESGKDIGIKSQAQPLIFLHGHSLDTRMWRPQVEYFAKKGYRVICMDFRGYGKSSEQREDLQFTHVDDVIALMDSLQINKAHVVGLSMGSFVTGDMVAMYPERLLSCVMASGGIRNAPGPSEPMDSIESAKRDEEIAALKEKGIDNYKKEWIEALIKSGGSEREKMREALTEMVSDWDAWQPLHKEVRLFYGKEACQALKEKCPDVPTLIVVGENDAHGRSWMLDYLPNGEQTIIPNCGHMLNMDQPEAFNAVIEAFLLANK